jgi:hypothetical protein
MGVDQMKDWITKFHADGGYFHVAPPAQGAYSPAAGDVKVAEHPIDARMGGCKWSDLLRGAERAQITFNWPVETPRRAWRTYTFHALGSNFVLRAGNGMPWQMVDTCFYHNPVHPILVSDEVSGIIGDRQMEQFTESRKTRAFVQSRKREK